MQPALLRELSGYAPTDPGQEVLRQAVLLLVGADPQVHRRESPVHVTAGGVVLDPRGERTLLVLHRKVGRWLQPGGHLEATDASPGAAALREVAEETGVPGVRLLPGLVHLDRHPAPCGAQEHLDLRWCVVAPAGARPVHDEESLDARWFPLDALPADAEPLRPMLAAARARLLRPGRVRPGPAARPGAGAAD